MFVVCATFNRNSFRKFGLILLLAAFGATTAQNVEVACVFQWTIFTEYSCRLENITVLDPAATVVFVGEHLLEMTNADVEVVQIRNSNTPFMIPEMFTSFPNMFELDIQSSNLESIDIPSSVQLIWLIIYQNNIQHITGGSIRGQERISYLELMSNRIETIDEDAFADLGTLNSLVLINNQLTEIQGTTLHNLTRLSYLDFERNNLTRISEQTFSRNTNLYSLYLEFNQISAIHPRFASELTNLRFINLIGNECINRSFPLQDERGWMDMNAALQTCYNSYNGTVPELRTITMQFTGNLAIFDEFGNIIARI